MQPLCCSLFPVMTRTQQLQPPVLRHSGCDVNPGSMSQQSISAQAHIWCGQMLACLAVHASPAAIGSLELATANMPCTGNQMCAPIEHNSNHAPAKSHNQRLCPKIKSTGTIRDVTLKGCSHARDQPSQVLSCRKVCRSAPGCMEY